MSRIRTLALAAALAPLTLGATACLPRLLTNPMGALTDAVESGARGGLQAGLEGAVECKPLKERKVSFEEEHSLGGALSLNWISRGGGLTGAASEGTPFAAAPTREAQRELNVVGRNLAVQSERPSRPWTFGLLESEGFNAVSAPGGYVFVTRGLLRKTDDEAQLAGVLAHEIAHVTLKHAVQEYGKAVHQECTRGRVAQGFSEGATRELRHQAQVPFLSDTALKGLSGGTLDLEKLDGETKAFLQGATAGLLKGLLDRGYSADDEYAADLVAVQLRAQAGYAPEAYVEFLARLPEHGEKGLATAHPSKEKRQERLRKFLAEQAAAKDDPLQLAPATTLAKARGPLSGALAKVKALPPSQQQAAPATP